MLDKFLREEAGGEVALALRLGWFLQIDVDFCRLVAENAAADHELKRVKFCEEVFNFYQEFIVVDFSVSIVVKSLNHQADLFRLDYSSNKYSRFESNCLPSVATHPSSKLIRGNLS